MRVGEWKKHQVSTVVLTKRKTTHAMECVARKNDAAEFAADHVAR
jgi:hypothetical protein